MDALNYVLLLKYYLSGPSFTFDCKRRMSLSFGVTLFARNSCNLSILSYPQWARKLKKVQAKKNLVKSNKSIWRKILLPKFHFLQFQNWPKINFWTRKKFKTAKNAISRKKFFWFIWFHEFFCLDFFKFSGPLWID